LMKEHHASYWYAFIIGAFISIFLVRNYLFSCVLSSGYLDVGWWPH
jgi:hypothetical protein